MSILFSNNAYTKLAQGITASATEFTVTPSTGALFPSPLSTGDYFLCTLVGTDGSLEIVKVTGRTGDVFTIERGQEYTTAAAFAADTVVENRLTAGSLTELLNVTYATAEEILAGEADYKAMSPAAFAEAYPTDGSSGSIVVTGDDGKIDADLLPYGLATELAPGMVERATDAEATAGTDTTRYMSPAQIKELTFGKFSSLPNADSIVLADSSGKISTDWLDVPEDIYYITSSSTWTCTSSGLYSVFGLCGGAGGGYAASTGYSGGSGGGGGGAGPCKEWIMRLVEGDTLECVIGEGGSSGADGGLTTVNGINATPDGSSTPATAGQYGSGRSQHTGTGGSGAGGGGGGAGTCSNSRSGNGGVYGKAGETATVSSVASSSYGYGAGGSALSGLSYISDLITLGAAGSGNASTGTVCGDDHGNGAGGGGAGGLIIQGSPLISPAGNGAKNTYGTGGTGYGAGGGGSGFGGIRTYGAGGSGAQGIVLIRRIGA